jgi:hypothetical protein
MLISRWLSTITDAYARSSISIIRIVAAYCERIGITGISALPCYVRYPFSRGYCRASDRGITAATIVEGIILVGATANVISSAAATFAYRHKYIALGTSWKQTACSPWALTCPYRFYSNGED